MSSLTEKMLQQERERERSAINKAVLERFAHLWVEEPASPAVGAGDIGRHITWAHQLVRGESARDVGTKPLSLKSPEQIEEIRLKEKKRKHDIAVSKVLKAFATFERRTSRLQVLTKELGSYDGKIVSGVISAWRAVWRVAKLEMSIAAVIVSVESAGRAYHVAMTELQKLESEEGA